MIVPSRRESRWLPGFFFNQAALRAPRGAESPAISFSLPFVISRRIVALLRFYVFSKMIFVLRTLGAK